MGYEDRDYMRIEGAERAAGNSNPLWWVLGLIGLILVVSFFRRGATSPGIPPAVRGLIEASGPKQISALQLKTEDVPTDQLLPVLRAYFHQRGYDSTIRESADRTSASATFTRQSASERLSQHAIYQHISSGHATLKPRHTLVFQMFRVGSDEDDPRPMQQMVELSRQLQQHLEAQFPGIVTQVDDAPRPVAYDDYE